MFMKVVSIELHCSPSPYPPNCPRSWCLDIHSLYSEYMCRSDHTIFYQDLPMFRLGLHLWCKHWCFEDSSIRTLGPYQMVVCKLPSKAWKDLCNRMGSLNMKGLKSHSPFDFIQLEAHTSYLLASSMLSCKSCLHPSFNRRHCHF